MRSFNVYTGDGNFGTSRDHEIEARDLDHAVEIYKQGCAPEVAEAFDEDGDENYASLTIYEYLGARAYNGGAYFVAEIWDAEHDPRVQPA